MGSTSRQIAASLAAIGLIVAGCSSSATPAFTAEPSQTATEAPSASEAPTEAPSTNAPASPVDAVVAYANSGAKPSRAYKIAYIVECANENGYCLTRTKAMDDAAAKYGFTYKTFNSVFNPATQLKQVQDAVSGGYDGYIFAPAAGQAGCQAWKQYIVPTGQPVVSIDIPMCGDANYTPGLAATVTMQSEDYFFQHVDNAFASCASPCKAAAVGGFTGSDLFGYWEAAIKKAAANHPNVNIVSDQPGNFDPNVANKAIAAALTAHPDLSLVISSWDQMTLGVDAAIKAAGKAPGTDVRIYSTGGTKDALSRVTAGTWSETTILLPYQEGYYAAVALLMALEGNPVNGYVNEAELPEVTNGPGTIFVTKDNASRFTPQY